MTDTDCDDILDELDRLLNDPERPIEAYRVWALLAEARDPVRQAPIRQATAG